MDKIQRIAELNAQRPGFLNLLGGEIIDLDLAAGSCTFRIIVPLTYCHTVDVVQGGFVAAMLDAAISHAVFAQTPDIVNVSTLELSTRYFGATRGNIPLTVVGRVDKATFKTAFLSGEIRDPQGEVTATVTAVAKLVRKRP